MLPLFGALLLSAAPVPRIAVLDLTARGINPQTAEALSLLLPTEVRRRAPGAQVTTSGELATLLGIERQKQLLGCSNDSNCFMELADALGTGELVRGSVGRVGGTWVLELQRMDLVRQRSMGSTTRTVTREDALVGALTGAVEELFPVQLFAARPVKTLPVVLWGAGGALIVAGAVALGVEQSIQTRFDAQQPGGASAGAPTVTRADSQTAKVLFPISLTAGALGLASVVAGTILHFASAPVAVAVAPNGGGVTVAVGGSF